MHGNVEGESLVGPVDEIGYENQVARTGDRQEFRQPLNQSDPAARGITTKITTE